VTRLECDLGQGRFGNEPASAMAGNMNGVSDGSLPDHESGLRRLMADATGVPYQAFKTLADARLDPDGVVVLEGDDGGQIYGVFPTSIVSCAEDCLRRLLGDLDAIAWPHNPSDMARVVYERRAVGQGIAGGMGGGQLSADGWVHLEFCELGLDDEIRAVVRGEKDRIRAPET
jgi:hypothetical protein